MSTEKVVKEPVKVTMSNLKTMLDQGKSKEEIGKEFGLNAAQTSKLFKQAKEAGLVIKIKRVVKPRPAAFTLVVDEELTETVVSPTPKAKKEKVKDDSDLLQVTNTKEETSDTTNDW